MEVFYYKESLPSLDNICQGRLPQVTPQRMSAPFFTRVFVAATLLSGWSGFLHAQSTQSISGSEVQDLSIKGPQSDSPFFIERQEAQAALANEGREGFGMYVPKPPHPPIQKQIKKFFKGMFASVKFRQNGDVLPMLVSVDPPEFSASEHPDLTVTLKVSNSQRREIELLYPTDQRLEIITKDSTGNVVNRWSEDRTFDPTEGFTEINPSEFVIYSEEMSTTAMKAGETYTIEASLAGQKGYTTSTTITPTP